MLFRRVTASGIGMYDAYTLVVARRGLTWPREIMAAIQPYQDVLVAELELLDDGT